MNPLRYVVAMTVALARRPRLIPTALRQVARLAPQRWWTQAPWVPMPPAEYLEFRAVTANGSADGPLSVHDTVVWLEWCRSMGSLPRR